MSGYGEYHGNPGSQFVIVGFGPESLFSEVKPVVAPEANDGVVGEVECFKFVYESSQQCINVADACVVTVSELIDFLIWDGC